MNIYKYIISFFCFICSFVASAQRTGTMDIAGQQCQYDTLVYRHVGPGSTYMQLQFNNINYDGDAYKMRLHLIKVDISNPYVKVSPYLAEGKYYGMDKQNSDTKRLKRNGYKPIASIMGGAFVQSNNTSSVCSMYEITGSVVSDGRALYDDGASTPKFAIDNQSVAHVTNMSLTATLIHGNTSLSIGNINHYRDHGDGKGQLTLFCNNFVRSLASDTKTGVDVRVKVNSNDGKILIGSENKCTVMEILSGCGHTINAGEAVISSNGNLASTLSSFSVGDEININMSYNCDDATGLEITDQVTSMSGFSIYKGIVQPYPGYPKDGKLYAQCFSGASKDGRMAFFGDLEISDNSTAPCICASYAARNLGVYNAIWLDGGPSAEMTVDDNFVTVNSGLTSQGRFIPGAIAIFSVAPDDNNIVSIEPLDPTTKTIEKGATWSPVIYGFNKYGERVIFDLGNNSIIEMKCPEGLGTISNGMFTATNIGNGTLQITLKSTLQTISIPLVVKKYERFTVYPTDLFTGEDRSCKIKTFYTDDSGTTEIPSANVDWSTNATQTISSCANGLICPGMEGYGNVYATYNGITSTVNVTVENLSYQAYEDKYVNFKDEIEGTVEVDEQLPSVPTSFRITVQSEPQSTVSVFYTTNAKTSNKVSHSQSAVVPDSGIANIDVTLDYDAVDTYPVTVDYISGTSKKDLEDYSSPYVVRDLTAYYYNTKPTAILEITAQESLLPVNNQLYNLQGMKVSSTYKGIVIRRGKKYLQ